MNKFFETLSSYLIGITVTVVIVFFIWKGLSNMVVYTEPKVGEIEQSTLNSQKIEVVEKWIFENQILHRISTLERALQDKDNEMKNLKIKLSGLERDHTDILEYYEKNCADKKKEKKTSTKQRNVIEKTSRVVEYVDCQKAKQTFIRCSGSTSMECQKTRDVIHLCQ